MMHEDAIVAEVRKIREHLASQFDFDVHAIFKDLQQRQSLLGERLVRLPSLRNSSYASRVGEGNVPYPQDHPKQTPK
jgi:hypothetical protein